MDLFFECQSGISGDMTLGALMDLGVDPKAIIEGLGALSALGFRLGSETVKQSGIRATRALVEVDESKDVHRSWPELRKIVEDAKLPPRVERRALAAFERIALAEAKIHAVDINRIHFHEVGCLDAIIDVAGSMLALDILGVERVRCSPLNVGRGTVRALHGVLPVPAPATAEILKGIPCYQDDLEGELVTPTGAAIIATISEGFGPMPEFTVEKTGYGAGTRVHEHRPNCLRVCAGQYAQSAIGQGLERERLRLLTAEMDDMSGEVFTALFERLFESGALDVNLIPIHMKKCRPGISLQVLAQEAKVSALIETVLRESSTFGVKVIDVDRLCLPRRMETVETPYGTVAVKVGEWEGRLVKAKPEFDQCLQRAKEAGVSVREVLLSANQQIAVKYGPGKNQ
jgi:pyridinium-3,5-bisthiocarboxylic acid mononucleotide nickel chelatase